MLPYDSISRKVNMGLLWNSAAPAPYSPPFVNGTFMLVLAAIYFFMNTATVYTFITGLSASLVETSGTNIPNNLGLAIIACLEGLIAYYLPHLLDPSQGYLGQSAVLLVVAVAFILSLPAWNSFLAQFYSGQLVSGQLSQNGAILNAAIFALLLYGFGNRVGAGSDA